MNDYKELVAELRKWQTLGDAPIGNGFGVIVDKLTLKHAANAIEQLIKERDAAVADLKGLHDALEGRGLCCYACKNDVFNYDKSVCAGCALQDNWEWRGVQEDNT